MLTRIIFFGQIFIFASSMFVAGYLFRDPTSNFAYKVSPHLVSAIVYIQSYQQQNTHLPSRYDFKNWSENLHNNWEFRYYPNLLDEPGGQKNNFVVGAWTGDEMQYFYSWEQSFSYENDLATKIMQLDGVKLGPGYKFKEGKILAPALTNP